MIEAADAERRRVGRDLHDGAQQRLLAVGNLLKVVGRKLGDEHDVAEVLRLAQEELGEAHADLRDLARGLHPVALAERGLAGALQSLTVGSPMPVSLDVRDGELPEDIALAAYFIVSESLTNASKYADASAIQIRVAPEDGALVVEVDDDGRGGADTSAGTGLRGLADRIDALGGSFRSSTAHPARAPASRRPAASSGFLGDSGSRRHLELSDCRCGPKPSRCRDPTKGAFPCAPISASPASPPCRPHRDRSGRRRERQRGRQHPPPRHADRQQDRGRRLGRRRAVHHRHRRRVLARRGAAAGRAGACRRGRRARCDMGARGGCAA